MALKTETQLFVMVLKRVVNTRNHETLFAIREEGDIATLIIILRVVIGKDNGR